MAALGRALGGKEGPGQAKRSVALGSSAGPQMCVLTPGLLQNALIKSWASSLRWAAMGLLQDTHPLQDIQKRCSVTLSANGDEQVRLEAETWPSAVT